MYNKGIIQKVSKNEIVQQVLLVCDKGSFKKLCKFVQGLESDDDMIGIVPVNFHAKSDERNFLFVIWEASKFLKESLNLVKKGMQYIFLVCSVGDFIV